MILLRRTTAFGLLGATEDGVLLRRSAGFTLIELLLSVALMALLSTLLAGVFSNCRRSAAAVQEVSDRLRKETILRESLQSELDLSASAFSFEYTGDRLRGFSFMSHGKFSGRRLRLRVRYVFEPDPENSSHRLNRYVIADGIGVTETKETILTGVRDPVIEGHSEAAGEFVAAEKLPGIPNLIRLKFRLLRTAPAAGAPVESAPADDIHVILINAYAQQFS